MNRIGYGFLFGMVVLGIGALLAVDLLFGVELAVVRAVLALSLIALGARMVVHTWSRRRPPDLAGEAWLADRRFVAESLEGDAHYDVVFGRGLIDLTGVAEPDRDVTVEVDTMFGHTVVKVDPAIPYDVEGTSAFAEVRMPDRSAAAVGSVRYRAPADHPPRLHLRVHAIFGACEVVEAGVAAPAA
ncbi:MAG: hypothetical protein H6708_27550 [Kofleriaceae bacterium]|nr:hypothetical protein [Kofleriaceae bacterium]